MHFSSARGEVTITQPSAELILIVAKGHLDAAFAAQIQDAVGPMLTHGHRPHLFFDAEEANGLDTKFRTEMTPWHKDIQDKVQSQNILVKSKILQMAITVANMAMGNLLKAYNKRREFEAAMAAARVKSAGS